MVTKGGKTRNGVLTTSEFSVDWIDIGRTEPAIEFQLKSGGLELNPLQQERQSIGSDLLQGVRSFVLRNVGAPLVEPFAQRSTVVARIAIFGGGDDKAGDRNAREEKEEHEGFAFRHVARMPSGIVAVNPNSYSSGIGDDFPLLASDDVRPAIFKVGAGAGERTDGLGAIAFVLAGGPGGLFDSGQR